jgi:predicted phosphoribosyltransferase
VPVADRIDAGRRLAQALTHLAGRRPIVLGLPRGGVPVAHEVALALHAPLDVLVARKLGAPDQPELAIGAIARGARYIDPMVAAATGVTDAYLEQVATQEGQELERREYEYRRGRPPLDFTGRTVILVDDGLATGATARAAIAAIRQQGGTRVVLAVPVGAPESVDRLQHKVDELVCLEAPANFRAVSLHYHEFDATTDAEVHRYLADPATHTLS